jgi:pyrimidine-nucleoside phosphorylase
MLVVELIEKKKLGRELTDAEIDYLVANFALGAIPDYQMAALLMATYFKGVNDREGRRFLHAMIHSGEQLSYPNIPARKVDKHSTGGVGDKTSLIIAPVVAEAGIPVPMISGRALGHTGGTLDKLESIPGLSVRLTHRELESILKKYNCVFGAQTDSLVPADRKLYALRDVTSTVEIPPLIAASILSKKIAEGTDALAMDVKIGSGGFLPDEDSARELALRLVEWSRAYNVETIAFGTDMNEPLGNTAGNGPEIEECLRILQTGSGEPRLLEISTLLGATMLQLGGVSKSQHEAREKFTDILKSGKAYTRFQRIAEAQGAIPESWKMFESGVPASFEREIKSSKDGFIGEILPREIGYALVDLGAGRRVASDPVDPSAGVRFFKKRGDRVTRGEPLALAQWSSESANSPAALARIETAFVITESQPVPRPLVYFRTDANGASAYKS